MQTLHITDPEFENFPHQSSSVDQIFLLSTLGETVFNFRNRFARNDTTNHIQKD